MGFEYGFSTAAPTRLVLWEAQYGDFVNVAQPIIDQFISADRAKWGQRRGARAAAAARLRGQGPEHSSARLERFLQLCAERNMVVAYPSTPAQYFHILRRQALRARAHGRSMLMQPKSLLRLPAAASQPRAISPSGGVPAGDRRSRRWRRDATTCARLVLCTAKMYYDLLAAQAARRRRRARARRRAVSVAGRRRSRRSSTAIRTIEEVVWAQEEPKNMGAWTYVAPRLRVATGNMLTIRYIGRPERASPAEGYSKAHEEEQKRIVAEVLEPARRRARKTQD